MSVALLGLLLLQFYWIKNVHETTESRFNDRVKNALETTAEDLEKIEAMRLIQPELFEQGLKGSYADFVNSEFGDVMQVDESIEIRDTVITKDGEMYHFLVLKGTTIDTATGLLAEHRVITKSLGDIMPSDLGSSVITFNDSNSFAIQVDNSFDQQIMNKAKFINDMMVELFTRNYFDEIGLRVNLIVLDSLLGKNLEKNELDTNYSFNIVSTEGKTPSFVQTTSKLDTDLASSAFKTELYPSDVVPSNYELILDIPNSRLFLWKEMAGTLLGSVLLVLIIVFAFYLAVSTIYKQKQLSEIKNDFISNMTHELKTPISTISLACEAIQDPDVSSDGDALDSFISMIDQENKRLGKLVENVLQTALLDKGKMKLNKSDIRLDNLVKDIVDAFQIRFKNKGGQIKIKQLDILTASVDRIHFGNIVYNLLDNALKYCKNVPEVEVKLRKIADSFVLEVKDNGIGIKREDQKRIFEKLYRVPTGDVHDVKGFGLGLNYVDSIVRLHNGKIDVDSAIGKGSTFKIKISYE